MKNNRLFLIICGVIILIFGLGIGGYFGYKKYFSTQASKENIAKDNQKNEEAENKTIEAPPAYTLVGYTGQVFGAKVPKTILSVSKIREGSRRTYQYFYTGLMIFH